MPIIIPVVAPGITLMAIEQATAPRLGPYSLRTVSSILPSSTTALAYFDELKSSVAPGGIENLYMLRRGQKADGTTLSVSANDRQRIAATVDPLQGTVAPDRTWTVAPVGGELIEFHHTDPALQLRPAVQAGLRRCFFEDRAALTLTSAATERDLTALMFWLTQPDQIRRVQFSTTGQLTQPQDVPWAKPFEESGHVWLGEWPDAFPSTLLLTARRPHSTWVNGADSTTGPIADADVLSIDLDYAIAAAHIAAWQQFPAVLKTAGDAGYQATQQMAASEFTRQAMAQQRRRRSGWSLTGPFGESMLSARVR